MNVAASILVVDDDVDTCKNLSDILSDLGYRVAVAHDGFAALELARRQPFDLALLDLKMPGMDGLTLCRELRRLRAETVALIVTAFAGKAPPGSDCQEEAVAAGVWQVLSKPLDLSRLLGLVGQALDQPLVLVVDDDPDLCASLGDLLRDQGYRVGVAHGEQTARARLADQVFRVVLVDLRLPDGDGQSVLRLVRELRPEARTVLITGHPGEMDPVIQQALKEGADAVCFKPFDVPRLLGTLRQLAQHSDK
jgi:CheY-like chemotaxis protein